MNLYLIEYYTRDGMINLAWIRGDSKLEAWNQLREKRPNAEERITCEEQISVTPLAVSDPSVVHDLT